MKLRPAWGIIVAAMVVSVVGCGAGPMEPMPGDDGMGMEAAVVSDRTVSCTLDFVVVSTTAEVAAQ